MEAQNRREQILSTAYEITGKNGIEGLHARTVATELGINHAAVHYYFPKRVDLLVHMVPYVKKRFLADLERVQANASHATQRLEMHIALYEAYAMPASRFFRVCASLFVAASHEPALREPIQQLLREQQELLQRDLDAALHEGKVNRQSRFADGEVLSCFLTGMCYRAQLSGAVATEPLMDQLFASLFTR